MFKFNNEENGKIKLVILYENETAPNTEEDWSRLQKDERVLVLTKSEELYKSPDIYLINGEEIPAEKTPAAGIYLRKGSKGNILSAIKVEKNNQTVMFWTADDEKLRWKNTTILSYNEYGSFELKDFYDWTSGDYRENGIIAFWNGANGVPEDEQYDIFTLNSEGSNMIGKSLIHDYIDRASHIGFIFRGEEQSGRIVKRQYKGQYYHYNTPVEEIDIPDGKMWTLLYGEVSSQSIHPMVRIYPQKRGNIYLREDYFTFNEGKQTFVSIKYSKQHYKPLTAKTNPAIMFLDNPSTICTIYFLEESLY